jgi:hypothetical protein
MDVDVDDLDAAQQRNLNELLETSGRDGARLVDDLDSDTRRDFLSDGGVCRVPEIGIPSTMGDSRLYLVGTGGDCGGRFDTEAQKKEWRQSVAESRSNSDIDEADLNEYIELTKEVSSRENIENTRAILDIDGSKSGLVCVLGETRSAVRYADEGYDVELEPGGGEFDLKIADDADQEFVEVKAPPKDQDSQWVRTKMSEVDNSRDGKLKRAKENGLDVSAENAVLEIHANDAQPVSEWNDAIQTAIDTREIAGIDSGISEIRLISPDGNAVLFTP